MGQNRKACRLYQACIEPDIAGAHNGGNVGFALFQLAQDRGFTSLAVEYVGPHEARRVAHCSAVARQVHRFRAQRELTE